MTFKQTIVTTALGGIIGGAFTLGAAFVATRNPTPTVINLDAIPELKNWASDERVQDRKIGSLQDRVGELKDRIGTLEGQMQVLLRFPHGLTSAVYLDGKKHLVEAVVKMFPTEQFEVATTGFPSVSTSRYPSRASTSATASAGRRYHVKASKAPAAGAFVEERQLSGQDASIQVEEPVVRVLVKRR